MPDVKIITNPVSRTNNKRSTLSVTKTILNDFNDMRDRYSDLSGIRHTQKDFLAALLASFNTELLKEETVQLSRLYTCENDLEKRCTILQKLGCYVEQILRARQIPRDGAETIIFALNDQDLKVREIAIASLEKVVNVLEINDSLTRETVILVLKKNNLVENLRNLQQINDIHSKTDIPAITQRMLKTIERTVAPTKKNQDLPKGTKLETIGVSSES
ncbi:MAG: hypothetical protein ACFFD4_18130 [Candidatus Odinarchaeota archaeon]